MQITVQNHQKRVPINQTRIKKIAKKILLREGVKEGFLSLVFVTDQKIKSLNKQFLKRNYVTDVLSFDLRVSTRLKSKMEGEVVISAATARKNALVYETKVGDEILLYIIHGILHLLGYDDHKQKDIKRMRKKEEELMKYVKRYYQK